MVAAARWFTRAVELSLRQEAMRYQDAEQDSQQVGHSFASTSKRSLAFQHHFTMATARWPD